MPQHKKLSILPLRLPPIPHDLPPSMRQYLEQHHAALEAYAKSMASIDICSGLTKFSDAANKGYFLGFTRNDTGYDDGTPVFVVGDRGNERYIEFDGANFALGKDTTVSAAGARHLVYGIQTGIGFDGDTVTFDPPFPEGIVPKVVFGSGYKTYDSSLATDQAPIVRAKALTNEGFTIFARIWGGGELTARTSEFGGTANVTSDTAAKIPPAESYIDQYIYVYKIHLAVLTNDLGLPIPTSATVGLYASDGTGPFQLYDTINVSNSTESDKTFDRQDAVTIDGLGADSVFKIQVDSESHSGVATLTCDEVRYDTSEQTSVDATEGGSGVTWIAFAGQ